MLRNHDTASAGHAPRLTAVVAASVAAVTVAVAIPVGMAWALSSTPAGLLTPVPSNAGPVPNAAVNDVNCPSAGSCTAVGDYADTIGITNAMTLTLSGGTWTAAQMLGPSNAPDYTFANLNGVSCFSVGNCVAVGDYRVSTVQTEGFYAVETAGVWVRGVALPVPLDAVANPAQTTFLSASCVTSGTVCMLLGEYTTSGSVHSVIDTYTTGSGITDTEEISPLAGELGVGLNSISCPNATHCVAVGAQSTATSETATYAIMNGAGSWGLPGILSNPHGAAIPSEYLAAVSCIDQNDCVAAGNWLDNNSNGFAETSTMTGGTWAKPVNLGEPSNLSNPFLDDISCVGSTSACTVVGALSDHNGGLHAASAQMTNGQWGQLAATSTPAGSIPDHELLAVSCSGVQCTSVGYYNSSTGNGGTDGMAASWTPATPPGAVSQLHGFARSPTTAQLTWVAPILLGSGLSRYEVFAQLANGPVIDKGPTLATSAQLSKLSAGGVYHLFVAAVATDGQSSPLSEVTTNLPATTPSAPKITRVIGLPHGLRVLWAAPSSTGGAPITSYQVTANCAGSVKSTRYSGSSRAGAVTGLRVGGSCILRVIASNRVGAGPLSGPAVGRPLA